MSPSASSRIDVPAGDPTSPNQESLSLSKRAASVLLGCFILWQLVYLTVANVVETAPVLLRRWPEKHQQFTSFIDQSRNATEASKASGLAGLIRLTDRWGQRTAQPQRWSLFAPNVAKQTGFLALELKWHDVESSAWLYSDDEPVDSTSYWRASGNRFHNVEQNLRITFAVSQGESNDDARQRWSHQIQRKLETDCDVMMAWIRIRLIDFYADYPDVATPDEVILHCRGFQIPAPGQRVESPSAAVPYSLAIARWRPKLDVPVGVLPMEAFDPVEHRFVFQSYSAESP
ncbi:MAG: hypothetical protein AAGI63_02740 [Planctomycetota bacterium]